MARTKYRGESRKYGLRSSLRPKEGSTISGVVLVADEEGRGFAYITFAEAFVEAVGKAMPQGAGVDTPCFIKVTHHATLSGWKVYSYYLDGTKGVLLWESKEKPNWLKRIRRIDYE